MSPRPAVAPVPVPVRALLAALTIAGLLGACSGSSSGTPATTSSPGEAVVVEPAAATGQQGDQGATGDAGQAATSQGGTPLIGTSCDQAGEGTTTSDGDGELVCTLMMGDGKLIWAWPDGTISADGPASASGGSSDLADVFGGGTCDESSTVDRYSSPIVDPATVSYIDPLGAMTATHITPVDHIYVYYPDGPMAPDTNRVLSPADGRVVAIEDFQASNGYPYPDHRIVIEHSCSLYSVFIHVGELRGPLADALVDGHLAEPVPVHAGEQIADDSADPNFDFSTFDQSVVLDLANPASYSLAEQWKVHTANPFDYFPDDVRAAYEQLSLRTEAPFDGRIDWDLPGTAMGVWFVEGTNGYRGMGDQTAAYGNHGDVAHGYWDTHLAIAPDSVDRSSFVWSIGDWDGCPCQFTSVGGVDPSTIVASDTPTVVQLVERTYVQADGSPMDPAHPTKGRRVQAGTTVVGLLALQVHEDGSMTVEKLPGLTSPEQFTGFGPDALTYVR
ncbi:MAG: hypothetical protein U0Q03_16335 [Acidimicrobiales bacterium]